MYLYAWEIKIYLRFGDIFIRESVVRKKYINWDDIVIEEFQRKLKLSIHLGESNIWGWRGGIIFGGHNQLKNQLKLSFDNWTLMTQFNLDYIK